MAALTELHNQTREIVDHALRSVDPSRAVRETVKLDGTSLRIVDHLVDVSTTSVYVIGFGKAATAMARGLEQALGGLVREGIISDPLAPNSLNADRWQTYAGGHPVPNQASLDAARASFNLLDQANAEQALVIFLVSGGGSAMFEWPASEDISLQDLQVANQLLVTSGASINEINAVRRAFSAVKGGHLCERAPQVQLISLIVSDTNQGDHASVASGPTFPPAPGTPPAMEVIRQYRLEALLPPPILNCIAHQAKQSPHSHAREAPYYVLLDNYSAISAATRKCLDLGFVVETATDVSEQAVDTGARLLLKRLELSRDARSCVVSGGEFSCPVKGDGKGGRNLETVLRCALMMEEDRPDYPAVAVSVATDGIDGNSPAAGALADNSTIHQARLLGIDARAFLERSDSYGFFRQVGNLIVTGPTGTNVRDLRVLLKDARA